MYKHIVTVKQIGVLVILGLLSGCQPAIPETPSSSTPRTGESSTAPTPAPSTGESSAAPTPTPTPEPTPTPALLSILNVLVHDEDTVLQTGAQVSVKSDNQAVSNFASTAVFKDGKYVVQDTPTNVALLVTVTKPGFTTRSQVVSISPDEKEKTLSFKDKLAISTKPEIVAIDPPFSAALDPYSNITLTFSENMNTASVEKSFAIQSNSTQGSKFLVGTLIPIPLSVLGKKTDSVYDISHFNIQWDTDRVLKLTPKIRLPIAHDNNFRFIFSYLDNGGDGYIKDSGGNKGRQPVESSSTPDGPVFIRNKYEPFIPFSVKEDPKDGAEVLQLLPSDSPSGDSIKIIYSEPMKYTVVSGEEVVGGADGLVSGAPAGGGKVTAQQAITNYSLSVNGTPVAWPASAVATFDDASTIRIAVASTDNLFKTGDTGELTFNTILNTSYKLLKTSRKSFNVP